MQRARTDLELEQRDGRAGTLQELSQATAGYWTRAASSRQRTTCKQIDGSSSMHIAILDRRAGELSFDLVFRRIPRRAVAKAPLTSQTRRKGLTDWVIRHRAPLLIATMQREPPPVHLCRR